MTDRLSDAVDALDDVPVPLSWTDVTARAAAASTPVDDVTVGAAPSHFRHPARRWLAAAAVVAIVATGAVIAWPDPSPVSVTTDEGPDRTTAPSTNTTVTSSPSSPSSSVTSVPPGPVTPTTQPAVGTAWRFGVEVWTGSEYLVWGSEAGEGDGTGRADGWRYDPDTDTVRDIPVAPIAPRDNGAGVWTGTELIVCCGRSQQQGQPGYDTASAAAFDPATDTWRALAPPPGGAGGYAVGAAWTGSSMLVAIQLGDPNAESFGNDGLGLYAYDPATDTWEERAKPIWGDRFGELVWTGDRLVIWSQKAPGVDGGIVYDPVADAWSWLPDLPSDHPVYGGSAAWVAGQLVVFGLDPKAGLNPRTGLVDDDRSSTVGYRLRLGDDAWRPMGPAPLRPIERYDGTPGSQSLAADPDGGRVVVYPTHGYESGAGGIEGAAPPKLLTYDPSTDVWTDLGADLGGAPYEPELLVGGDHLFRPDRARPEVLVLPR